MEKKNKKRQCELILDFVVERLHESGYISTPDQESVKALMLSGRLTPMHLLRIGGVGKKLVREIGELLGLEDSNGRFIPVGAREIWGILPTEVFAFQGSDDEDESVSSKLFMSEHVLDDGDE